MKALQFMSPNVMSVNDIATPKIGAKTLVLDPIEGVSDSDIKAGKNYYTIMQDNLKNLQFALSCTQ